LTLTGHPDGVNGPVRHLDELEESGSRIEA
jgi:hypothetical protein